jgi:hypothetical protein
MKKSIGDKVRSCTQAREDQYPDEDKKRDDDGKLYPMRFFVLMGIIRFKI